MAKIRREFADVLSEDGESFSFILAACLVGGDLTSRLPLPLIPRAPVPPLPRLADNNSGRSVGGGGTPPSAGSVTPPLLQQPPKYEPQLSLTPYCNTKVIHFIRHGCAAAQCGGHRD